MLNYQRVSRLHQNLRCPSLFWFQFCPIPPWAIRVQRYRMVDRWRGLESWSVRFWIAAEFHSFRVLASCQTEAWEKDVSGWCWNMTGLFSHSVGNVIIPIDLHIFQRGSNHQPCIVLAWSGLINLQRAQLENEWLICGTKTGFLKSLEPRGFLKYRVATNVQTYHILSMNHLSFPQPFLIYTCDVEHLHYIDLHTICSWCLRQWHSEGLKQLSVG